MTTDKDVTVNEIPPEDEINLAEGIAEKTNLDYAVEDADEVIDKLSEYGLEFDDDDSRKLFRQWLIEKLEDIMDQMEQGVE